MKTEVLSPSACAIQLAKLWKQAGKSFPIDAKELALAISSQKRGPITKVAGHSVSGIEGMLVQRPEQNCWYILYQENIAVAGRINFTLAHELGHYMLHRNSQNKFQCDQNNLLTYGEKSTKSLETEANKFASFLLMPIDDFRGQIEGKNGSLDLLGHCADRYNVSFTAATIKWLEFTSEAAMLIVARDGFVCWSYLSQSARKLKVFLPSGTPLPVNDFGLHNTDMRNNGRVVPPGVWHPKFEALESSILSDKFDLVIYLIQYPDANLVIHDDENESDVFDFLNARAEGFHLTK
jgi:hypothetical protein